MSAIIMLTLVLGIPAIVTAAITVVIAFVVRQLRPTPSVSLASFVGTVMPLLMLGWGLYRAWPWPWRTPELRHDGFPNLLVYAALPAWLLCLWLSHAVLRRREVGSIRP